MKKLLFKQFICLFFVMFLSSKSSADCSHWNPLYCEITKVNSEPSWLNWHCDCNYQAYPGCATKCMYGELANIVVTVGAAFAVIAVAAGLARQAQ